MSTKKRSIYNIKAVQQMTGVPAGTLRIWEHRYQVVRPERNRNGYRVYSQEDVQMIRWLSQQVKSGVSIGQAVEMLRQQEAQQSAALPSPVEEKGNNVLSDLWLRALTALKAYDERGAGLALEEALSLFSVERVALEFIVPLMDELRACYNQAELAQSQMNFANHFINLRLATVLSGLPMSMDKAMVLLACPAGEQHEQASIIFSVFLKRRGFRVIYGGSDLSSQELLEAAETLRPAYIAYVVDEGEEVFLQEAQVFSDALRKGREGRELAFELILPGRGLVGTNVQAIGMDLKSWEAWIHSHSL
ncbi:MerR family transcriptional regulator [Heliorestis acidaminivorans]|uniref:MerR family transcriptional regulator n=1 Tax=Heliorestis acidaminivorans TaxID=553427 RepID=A0A6I0F477_9FIRM|nr:MerR family transcriptional regulator [Heliorestis acidaminivorans]KAB2953632.1 MerR family transcriptional regulator [Heliorestis acidaminivorans]